MEPTMVSFGIDGARFNLRVGGVCLDDGHVLLHRDPFEEYWVLPGGRVHHGEAAAEAVVREVREELGIEVDVGRLLWIAESFFRFGDERWHEIGFYYEFALPTGSPLWAKERDHRGSEGPHELVYRWFRVADLPRLPLYPEFLRTALADPPVVTGHVVDRVSRL
jgi:ADP-ribose pyrophosphatase YjhB (NUDIX family)